MRRLARPIIRAGFIFILSYIALSGGCAYEPECDEAPEGTLKDPIGIAVSGKFLYITNANADLEYCSGFLAKVDLENNVITHIPTKYNGEDYSFLGEVAISGNYAYVAERSSNSLLKFDLDQEKIVGRALVGEDPFGVAVAAIGEGPTTLILVTNMSSDDISVIDASNMGKIKQISLVAWVRPTKIVISGEKAYVTQQNTSKISVIDIAPGSEKYLEFIYYIDWEGNCQGIASNGKNLYVSKRSPNSLAVIGTEFDKVINAIPLGSKPDGVAVNDHLVFVANFGSDNVYILNAVTNEITAIVEVGDGPTEIEISGDYAYVINFLSHNISVIDINSLKVTKTIP